MGISQYDAKEKQGIIISEGKVVSDPHSSDIIGQTLNRGQSSLFCNGNKFFSGLWLQKTIRIECSISAAKNLWLKGMIWE